MNDDAHSIGKGKWKVPAGSLVVDIGLVIALIWTVSGMQEAVKNLDRRVVAIETRDITPGAERRIAVIEAAIARQDLDRAEMIKLLNRIDDKLDAHLLQNGNGNGNSNGKREYQGG